MKRPIAVVCLTATSFAVSFASAAAPAPAPSRADAYASAPAYLKAVQPGAKIYPILTAGQRIPATGGSGDYLVVGIPDGLGLIRRGDRLLLLSNHELGQLQGAAAGPLPGGARVSEFTLALAQDASPGRVRAVSGRHAIERLIEGDTAKPVPPGTRRIAKLCSATLADAKVGFDRPIFLTGEESGGADTFDGRGGQAFAVYEGTARALPRLGRFRKENQVPVPFTGAKTVVFGLEDGPYQGTALFSQLYMYVGEKRPGAADAMSANGLDKGDLYVFVANDTAVHGEAQFKAKGASLRGRWVPMDWRLDDSVLEAASQAANAFDFARIEDGAADPVRAGEFWLATTGGAGSPFNLRGRIYRLTFDAERPTASATLTLVLDGSEGIVSPDNVDLNRHGELAICEDPGYDLKADLGLDRDARLWIYDIASGALTPVAEIDRGAARAHALAADRGNASVPESDVPGGWEVSGVVDAEEHLGRGAWILNVQAHSLRIVPVAETVTGGQYLQLVWRPKE